MWSECIKWRTCPLIKKTKQKQQPNKQTNKQKKRIYALTITANDDDTGDEVRRQQIDAPSLFRKPTKTAAAALRGVNIASVVEEDFRYAAAVHGKASVPQVAVIVQRVRLSAGLAKGDIGDRGRCWKGNGIFTNNFTIFYTHVLHRSIKNPNKLLLHCLFVYFMKLNCVLYA